MNDQKDVWYNIRWTHVLLLLVLFGSQAGLTVAFVEGEMGDLPFFLLFIYLIALMGWVARLARVPAGISDHVQKSRMKVQS
jgi:hypothetical protein